MRRREFIAGLAGAAVSPVMVRAQARKLPTIGLLGTGSPSTQGQWVNAFVQRLHELDWIEGRTVTIGGLCGTRRHSVRNLRTTGR
jgi:putative tryptophan/tyrosine transport system substrate-binding protein